MAGKREKDSIGLDWNARSEILLASASLPLDQIGDKLWDVRTEEIGLIELAYDWEGSGMATMGSLVGCAVVDDFDLPRDVLEGKKVDEILALLEKHLSRYGVAEKVSLSIEEKSGVGIKVDNCLLLPVEQKMKESEMRLRRFFAR